VFGFNWLSPRLVWLLVQLIQRLKCDPDTLRNGFYVGLQSRFVIRVPQVRLYIFNSRELGHLGIIEKIARVTGASFSSRRVAVLRSPGGEMRRRVEHRRQDPVGEAERRFSFSLAQGTPRREHLRARQQLVKYALPCSRYLLLAVPVSMSRPAMRFFIRVACRSHQIGVAQHNRPAGSSPAYPGWTAEDIG